MTSLKDKARRHGTRSKYAGDEPRRDEWVAHWPKDRKKKRRRLTLTKGKMKQRRKDKIIKRADQGAYQARLTAPWAILVRDDKEGRPWRSGWGTRSALAVPLVGC